MAGDREYSGKHTILIRLNLPNIKTGCTISFRGYNWFWIFIVGPHIGAILGVCLFHLLLKTSQAIEAERDLVMPHHEEYFKAESTKPHGIELYNVKTVADDVHSPPIDMSSARLRW